MTTVEPPISRNLAVGAVLLLAVLLAYFGISRAPFRVNLLEMVVLSLASGGALTLALQSAWRLRVRLAAAITWVVIMAIARTAVLPVVVLKLEPRGEGLFWGSLVLLGLASGGFVAATGLTVSCLSRLGLCVLLCLSLACTNPRPPDPHQAALRVWARHEATLEAVAAGRRVPEDDFVYASRFFEDVTGVVVPGWSPAHLGWAPTRETPRALEPIRAWFQANGDRLFWDEAAGRVRTRVQSSPQDPTPPGP
jgi:hypothetical protein